MQSSTNLNLSEWSIRDPKSTGGFQEVWHLKLNQIGAQRALWLRFSILVSANGFRQITETWAVSFHRNAYKDVAKVAVRQTHPISVFKSNQNGPFSISIGDCSLSDDHTKGAILSKGSSIRWDLKLQPDPSSESFNPVPDFLKSSNLLRARAVTVNEKLLFSGTFEVNGELVTVDQAPGIQGHISGPETANRWTWAQCNTFVNEKGDPCDFVLDGVVTHPRLFGKIPGPQFSAFYFFYQGQHHRFNDLWKSITLRSRSELTQWEFVAEQDDLSFRGVVKAEHKDFAGITYEDTNGSVLYCANSELAEMRVTVYRRGKLEASFDARGTAAFESVSRKKNPYVPILI